MSTNDNHLDEPFITTIPLGKASLAQRVNVCRNTVKSWHYTANLLIPAYREIFPLKNSGDPSSGKDYTVPLMPYQCWVLVRVGWVMKVYRTRIASHQYIKANPHNFSKAKFTAVLKEFKQSTQSTNKRAAA